MDDKISNKLRLIPSNPGVYLMKNATGKIIYIGKAKNLKKRINSYFTKTQFELPKTEILVSKIADFEYIVTRTEIDALILEANLIKKHRPKFNAALKDDKKYPYIKIDVKNNFPKVIVTRTILKDGSKYFGPYTEAHSIRRTLNLLEKVFRLRICNRKIPRENTNNPSFDQPCLNFQINKCDAPCIGNISYKNYRKKVEQVILFLKGKTDEIVKQLQKAMEQASEKNQFEKATELRDQIIRIGKISTKQIVRKTNLEDLDIIGIGRDDKLCCVVILKIREGRLIKKEHYFMENTYGKSNGNILNRFLTQYYNFQEDIAPKILTQTNPEDKELVSKWLNAEIFIPQKGDKKKLVEMAKQNAFLLVEEKKLAHLKSAHRTVFAVKELKDKLHLPKLPRKISAFDESNLQGSEAVASMVFFDNGKPKKSQYRRFKIKTVSGINDYLMIEEAVTRYLSHLEEKKYETPDMILIDGGKGQLTFAKKALEKYPYKIELFSIAKRLEEVFSINSNEPIIIPKTSYALKLLQQIRDEAHRFAIKYHKTLRNRKTSMSVLDRIPGIGRKRKMALLKYFHSLINIKRSSINDLQEVSGISKKIAVTIYNYLHKKTPRNIGE
ncbi:MAG: excinuclease ABC subunit UvrC [Candidatus Cloacimonetes bacterium]|nr:excinuclease ABC subunit UvrC [Candidatus Cloacimonadota bacterium]